MVLIGWKEVEQQPPRVKKKALDPAKLSLASMQTGGQVETRHKRLAEAIVVPITYLLVVHKVKSVVFSPHFCVCCYEL